MNLLTEHRTDFRNASTVVLLLHKLFPGSCPRNEPRAFAWTARNDRNRTGSPGPSGPSVSLYLYSCAKTFRLPAWNTRRLDLISQVRSKKVLCICTNKLVDALWKSVRRLFQGRQSKEERKKNMSVTNTKKATAATSQTIAEVFHEAIDSWKDLQDRFGPAVK